MAPSTNVIEIPQKENTIELLFYMTRNMGRTLHYWMKQNVGKINNDRKLNTMCFFKFWC